MKLKQNKQAKAALKVFFCAVEEWSLSDKQARALLGSLNSQEYEEYRRGIVNITSENVLLRLSYITTIYSNLRLLYSDENIVLWLKNSSELSSRWNGSTPLDLMTDNLDGILRIYNYLNGLSGS